MSGAGRATEAVLRASASDVLGRLGVSRAGPWVPLELEPYTRLLMYNRHGSELSSLLPGPLLQRGEGVESRLRDILAAAAGMCDERLASILAQEAPLTLPELESWNVPLERDGDHYLEVIGCFATKPRMHIIRGHAEPLLAAMVPRIRDLGVAVVENTIITNLLVQEGVCVGAVGLTKTGEMVVFRSAATAMGTGGAGQLFLNNLNPPDVVGDGYAIGYRAGAELVNMEFMQAGPGIVHPVKNILNSWAWMLHPKVYNSDGEEFLPRYIPEGMSLEQCMDHRAGHYPFSTYDGSQWIDVAIQKEILTGKGTPQGGVFIDFTRVSDDTLPTSRRGDEVRRMWATTREWLLNKRRIDVTREPVQVAVFGHAINGGMRVGENSETTVPRLFAAGEAAAGPHGADRLGGNMVVNLMVFGRRMGRFAAERAREGKVVWKADSLVAGEEARLKALLTTEGQIKPLGLKRSIQKAMWAGALVARNEERLQSCLQELALIRAQAKTNLHVQDTRELWHALEVEDMLYVGEIMVNSAILRTESRGSHYREDYPQRDDTRWQKSIVARQVDGGMQQYAERLTKQDSGISP